MHRNAPGDDAGSSPPRSITGQNATHGPAERPVLPSCDPVANDREVFDPARPAPQRELETSIDDDFTLFAVGDCTIMRPLSAYLRDAGFRR